MDIDGIRLASYPFSAAFDSGTEIEMAAVPSFWYRFTGWSGDLEGTENPSTLVIDCEKEVTARFSLNWPLIGGLSGGALLLAFLVFVLIIRRNSRFQLSSPSVFTEQ